MTIKVYTGTVPASSIQVIDEAPSGGGSPPEPPPADNLSWFTSKPSMSITNVGANLLQAMNPWGSITPSAPSGANGDSILGFAGILAASGMVFCEWRGKAGSLVAFGGGHNDYCGNDVYEFDLYAQTWAQLKPPHWPLFKDSGGYHAATEGEHWADATCTTTLESEPCTGHNYGVPEALPPDATFPQGAVLMGCIPVMTVPGQRGGMRSHVFDLATKQWARYSTNLVPTAFEFGGSCIDKTRNRYVMPLQGYMGYLDLTTRAWTKSNNSPFATGIVYMIWRHYTAADLYVGLSHYSTNRLWVFDPLTNTLTKPNFAQAFPYTGPGGGSCWSEQLGGFAFYGGQGESEVTVVKPPAGNPRTTPWDVSTITFSGATPGKDTLSGAGSHCKRFLEHKAAGGFLWLPSTQSPVQFFKL